LIPVRPTYSVSISDKICSLDFGVGKPTAIQFLFNYIISYNLKIQCEGKKAKSFKKGPALYSLKNRDGISY
jgi:hypothetical protein